MSKRVPPGGEVWISRYEHRYGGIVAQTDYAVYSTEEDCDAGNQGIVREWAHEFEIPEDTPWREYEDETGGRESLSCMGPYAVQGVKRIGDNKR